MVIFMAITFYLTDINSNHSYISDVASFKEKDSKQRLEVEHRCQDDADSGLPAGRPGLVRPGGGLRSTRGGRRVS